MLSGLVSSAIFSTHFRRCLFSLRGLETFRADLLVTVGISHHYRANRRFSRLPFGDRQSYGTRRS